MKHWMFRCEAVSRKASQSLDGELPLHQWIAVWMHLLMCKYCARFYRQMKLIRKAGRIEDTDPSTGEIPDRLSDEVKKRIKEKIRSS